MKIFGGKLGYVIIALSLVLLLGVSHQVGNLDCQDNLTNDSTINASGQQINVALAKTEVEKEKGLGGMNCMGEHEGMLFVFAEPSYESFWMKDMKFPLDIVWLNENGEVVFMENDVSPSSYPKTYSNDIPAKYVLELPAGQATNLGLCPGYKLRLDSTN